MKRFQQPRLIDAPLTVAIAQDALAENMERIAAEFDRMAETCKVPMMRDVMHGCAVERRRVAASHRALARKLREA